MSTNTVIYHSVTAVSVKLTHAFANLFLSRFGTLIKDFVRTFKPISYEVEWLSLQSPLYFFAK